MTTSNKEQIAQFLNTVPACAESPAELYGTIVKSPKETVKIIFESILIELAREDVCVTAAQCPSDAASSLGAIMTIKENARMLDAYDASCLREIVKSKFTPFSVAIRTPRVRLPSTGYFNALEGAYLKEFQLLD